MNHKIAPDSVSLRHSRFGKSPRPHLASHMSGTPRPLRRGAILSAELVLALPLITILFFAITQFGILWASQHKLSAAARAACRVASLPGSTLADIDRAVAQALGSQRLVDSRQLRVQRGPYSGDPVRVELRVPITAATPEMLKLFGFSLGDRQLVAQCTMRRE